MLHTQWTMSKVFLIKLFNDNFTKALSFTAGLSKLRYRFIINIEQENGS